MSLRVKCDMRPLHPQHGILRDGCRQVLQLVLTTLVVARVVTALDSIEFQRTCKCRQKHSYFSNKERAVHREMHVSYLETEGTLD